MSSRRPLCSPCPEHSRALENASTFCACLDSYARSPTDPPWASCTREFPSGTLWGGGRGAVNKVGSSVGEGREGEERLAGLRREWRWGSLGGDGVPGLGWGNKKS